MKNHLLAVCLFAATTSAFASDVSVSVVVGQPGFYGRIDLGNQPPPMVIYSRPVVITQHGRPTAVLQDVESFDRQRTALLLLLALASGQRDYQAGRTVSDRTADRRFRRRLARLGRG